MVLKKSKLVALKFCALKFLMKMTVFDVESTANSNNNNSNKQVIYE